MSPKVSSKPKIHEWRLTEDDLDLFHSFSRFHKLDENQAREHVQQHFCGVSEDLRMMSEIPFSYYCRPVVIAFIYLIEEECRLSSGLSDSEKYTLRNQLFCGFSPVWEAVLISRDILLRLGQDGAQLACLLLSKISCLFDYLGDLEFVRGDLEEILLHLSNMRHDISSDELQFLFDFAKPISLLR